MKCKQCVANNKALTMIKQKCNELTELICDENRTLSDRARSATQTVLYVEWLSENINIDKPITSSPKTIIALIDIDTTITKTRIITKDKEYEVVLEKHNGVSVKSDYYNHDGTLCFLFNSQYTQTNRVLKQSMWEEEDIEVKSITTDTEIDELRQTLSGDNCE